MLRLVYYDLSDHRTRSRVADCLLANGFDRIQYSVFIGTVKAAHWVKVWSQLESLFSEGHDEQDKIFSHVVPPHHFRKMSILGAPPEVEWILHEVPSIFFG